MLQQRDAFIQEVHNQAEEDENIIFLSADFGAPALDAFRSNFPRQFYHLGISEQNMIDVAIGLAQRDKKVITYAMAPFISMRCAEQHKIAAMMGLPIINIIAGVGLSYANAGPTHYATEDLAIFASMAGAAVYTCSDSVNAQNTAKKLIQEPNFSFVRLDRECGGKMQDQTNFNIELGFTRYFEGSKVAVISHGYSLRRLHDELAEHNDLRKKIALFDLFRFKPINPQIFEELVDFDYLVFVDEQMPYSSLGTLLSQQFNKYLPKAKQISFELNDNYLFENTGRLELNEANGLKMAQIIGKIHELIP